MLQKTPCQSLVLLPEELAMLAMMSVENPARPVGISQGSRIGQAQETMPMMMARPATLPTTDQTRT